MKVCPKRLSCACIARDVCYHHYVYATYWHACMLNLGDLGKKTNRKKDYMSSAEGTEERVDDKGDSGTYCTCEGDS